MKNTSFNTRKLVGLALLTAIVVVLQLVGNFIRFGAFEISLVLVPIVIGAALYGVAAGAWLGFVFSAVVLLSGSANTFMAFNVAATILVVLAKGTLAGLCAGLIYKLLEKKNAYLAVICAGIVCPVVNTGIFVIGCYLFFLPLCRSIADAMGFAGTTSDFIIFGLVGVNFLVELATNIILAPVILRIINLGRKK